MKRVSLLLALAAAAPAEARFNANSFDGTAQKAMTDWRQPGLAVVVVRNDEVVHLRGIGLRNTKTGQPVTPDTLFGIGSCSKAFAAASVAWLVSDGRLHWDDRVRDHVAWFEASDPWVTNALTIRDLLSHRSGLRSSAIRAAAKDRVSYLKSIKFSAPNHPFRAQYSYTNDMFTLAGQLVSEVTGKPWPEFTREVLWVPIGMLRTNADHRLSRSDPDSASPHVRVKGRLVQTSWFYEDDIAVPSGGVNSSARELGRWLRFQLNHGEIDQKRLIDRGVFKEQHTPQTPMRGELADSDFLEVLGDGPDGVRNEAYAFGWVSHTYRGEQVLSHSGSIDGFRCSIALLPDRRFGIAILGNGPNSRLLTALVQTAIDQELDVPARDWSLLFKRAQELEEKQADIAESARQAGRNRKLRPSVPLAEYVGRYADKGVFGEVKVQQKAGNLVLSLPRMDLRLAHWSGDTFEARPIWSYEMNRAGFVSFRLAADGSVQAFDFNEQRLSRIP